MEEWKKYKVGDLVSFQNGFAFKSSDFTSAGRYPVVKIKELKNGKVVISSDTTFVNSALSKYRIEKEDILFALTGDPVGRPNPGSWVGRVAKYGLEDIAYLNQRVGKISQCKSDLLNPKFLYYYFLLHDNHYALASKATGSASQANISTKTIEDIELTLPCLKTQNDIVAILDSIEQKIELNNRINHNLEEQAQALYKSWFVDFESFKDGKFVESELGMIPEGWQILSLGDITSKFGTGLNPRKNFKLGQGTNFYVTIKNMGDNRIYLDERCDKVNDEAISIIQKRSKLAKGDLLFSGIGTIGRVAIITETPRNWNTSESIFNMHPIDSIAPELMYVLLLSDEFQSYVMRNAQGGVQQGIRMSSLKEYKLAIPSTETMDRFTELIVPIISQIQENNNINDQLSSLRDSLLPRLMSGEITC